MARPPESISTSAPTLNRNMLSCGSSTWELCRLLMEVLESYWEANVQYPEDEQLTVPTAQPTAQQQTWMMRSRK